MYPRILALFLAAFWRFRRDLSSGLQGARWARGRVSRGTEADCKPLINRERLQRVTGTRRRAHVECALVTTGTAALCASSHLPARLRRCAGERDMNTAMKGMVLAAAMTALAGCATVGADVPLSAGDWVVARWTA